MCRQHRLRAPCRAQSAKEWRFLAGNLQHRRTKRTRKLSAILGQNQGAPRVNDDGLMSILPARISQCTGLRRVPWISVSPIDASLLRRPKDPDKSPDKGPQMPAGLVKAPSECSPSIWRSFTTSDAPTGSTPANQNSSSAGSGPIWRTSLASQSPDSRSTSVPVRWDPCSS